MAVWVAGATVAVGVGSMYMADQASDAAAAAQGDATAQAAITAEAQLELDRERLDFEYEMYDEQLARYDEWRAIYGPIEENLADFYNNLSPETFEAAGLEYNQQEFQKAKTETFETLQQRGLGTSGITAAVEGSMNITNAKERARIRRDAPFDVAEEQTKFYASGQGGPVYQPPGTEVSSAMGSMSSNVGTSGAAVTSSLQNEANIASSNAQSLWGSAGSMISTGLEYYGQNAPPTANEGETLT